MQQLIAVCHIVWACSLTVHYPWWRMPPSMHQCWGLLTGWPNAWVHRGGTS